MSISSLSDEELLGLYKSQSEQPSDISSISDEELLKMYKPKPTKQPTQQKPVAQPVIKQPKPVKKQPLTEEEKQAEIARIKAEFEARNKEIDREHRKKMAKLYGGAALEIGSAAIPFGAGLKLGSLALKASKPIAQQVIKNLATRGAIEGGLSGLVGGVGRGMVEDKDLKGIGLTALTDAGVGLVGGTALGAIGGKVATNVGKTGQRIKNIEAKQLAKKQPQVTKEVKAEVVEQPIKQVEEVVENVPQEFDINAYSESQPFFVKSSKGNILSAIKKEDGWYAQGEKVTRKKDIDYLNSQLELNKKDNLKTYNSMLSDLESEYGLWDSGNLSKTELDILNDLYKKGVVTREPGQAGVHETYNGVAKWIYRKNPTSQQLDNLIPEQVVEATPEQVSGDIKKRSLQQSVLEAKGTPKEVKEIIKEDMPTYEVMHNKDLIAQATKELEGNFDNELVRLASAKDFDALDYEKSHQIARELFGMGEYQKAVDLIDNVSENATKKGQAIQALSLWSNMTPEGAVYKAQKLIKEYNKKHSKKPIKLTDENIKTIANLQKEALNTTDELTKKQALAKTMSYVSDLIPKASLQKLKAYRNIAMLLNPKTLMRNTVGNALFNTIDTASKGLASGIDTLMSLKTGKKTRVAPQLEQYFKGGLKGLKTGYSEGLQGIDTRGLGQRFDLGSGRTFVGGNTERTTIADIIKAQQGNKLNTTKQYFEELLPKSRLGQAISQRSLQPLKNIPSDLMNSLETSLDIGLRTPDRAFYEATFAESVENMMKASEPQRKLAREKLQKKLTRAKSEKSIKRINQQLADLTKPTQEILEQAEQEALESVFQNQSKISDFALGLRSGINRIGTKEFGLGDVLIPYAQTPANLTQQAINYSPLGAVKGIANWTQGNQRQASLDLARSIIGSILIGAGYGLGKAGLTTPSQFDENYQKNKTIRENLQPLGIRPDQLGDMWYAPFQPMSSPIAVGTAMANNENPLYAGLNTVVDQPYLQGVTRGLRDIQEGDWAKAGTNVLASIPSQFVPTAFSQIAQTIDPYQRETYDPNKLKYGLNSAIAKVPFASKTLPEKVDVTGQPIERYKSEGGKKLYDIFLNPTFINEKTDDPVLSELKYIYDETKETSHFMPSANKKLKFKDVDGNEQKIELTGREFSEYQKRLGQRMYEEFDYVMDLPKYTNADEYGKIKLLEKAKKLVKDEVDNEMWNKKKAYKKSSYTKGN